MEGIDTGPNTHPRDSHLPPGGEQDKNDHPHFHFQNSPERESSLHKVTE